MDGCGGSGIVYPGSGFALEGQERRVLLGAKCGSFPVDRKRGEGRSRRCEGRRDQRQLFVTTKGE